MWKLTKMPAPAALCLLAFLAGSSSAAEQYLRCTDGLVTRGDRKLDVLHRCGEPDLKETVAERSWFDDDVTVRVETWTYNFGPHRFYHVVWFSGGKVIEIEAPGYGY